MIKKETIDLVNEQFNDALRMTKEMNHVCKRADEAMCTMNTIRNKFEEYRNIYDELTSKHAKNCTRIIEAQARLAKFIEGPAEDRIKAIAEEFNATSGLKYTLMNESTTYVDLKKEQVELEKEIEKYDIGANAKVTLIGGCHYAIKDLYTKFKNAEAEAKRQKEELAKKQAEAKPKTIKIMVDVSWPMSPREIQQAIDTLKAFESVGEDGIGLKSAVETLESFKKYVEKDIEKKTTVKQEGHIFKLSTAE
jgi:hypothetical protein